MSTMAQQAAQMIDMSPEQDRNLAFELIKKLVLAWDPDFTKATPVETQAMKTAEQEVVSGDVVNHKDMQWD